MGPLELAVGRADWSPCFHFAGTVSTLTTEENQRGSGNPRITLFRACQRLLTALDIKPKPAPMTYKPHLVPVPSPAGTPPDFVF